jgi:molecular chaperone GrpE
LDKKTKKNDENEQIIDETIEQDVGKDEEKTKDHHHESKHKRSESDYKQKYEEMFDQLLRLKAEYSNYMKRTQKEKESAYAEAKCDTVKAILPVFDNFERALKSESAHKTHSAFKEGMEKIYKQFTDTLDKESIECILSVGEKFDPELHFAVAHEEDPDKGDSEVVEEYQKGYRYKDKIIRHSMVKVVN